MEMVCSDVITLTPQLWDIRRKGTIYNYKGHTEVINAVQFSPDGKWVVTGSSDHTVKVGS